MPDSEILETLVGHLPADYTHKDRQDARRLVSAALEVVIDPHVNSAHVRDMLAGIEREYGCWIDDVRAACECARRDFSDGMESELGLNMKGALFMACLWLFEMQRPRWERSFTLSEQ